MEGVRVVNEKRARGAKSAKVAKKENAQKTKGGKMRRLRSNKGPDLCERTFKFGVRITKMVRRMPRDVAGQVIGRQVLRSGTSVGANTEEADAAESTEDFLHKLKIALKEAQETRFWLRNIREAGLLVDK